LFDGTIHVGISYSLEIKGYIGIVMSRKLILLLILVFSLPAFSGAPTVPPRVVEEFANPDNNPAGEPNECEGEGNPISRRLGNKFQKEVDYSGSLLNSVFFERYYNSRMTDEPGELWKRTKGSTVGYAFAESQEDLPELTGSIDQLVKTASIYVGRWSHNYSSKIELHVYRISYQDRFQVIYRRGDGLVAKGPVVNGNPNTNPSLKNNYTMTYGGRGSVQYNSGWWMVHEDGGDSILWFDGTTGKLKTIDYREGQKHTLSYESVAEGQIITVTDSYGLQLKIHEDIRGRVSSVDLPNGNSLSYMWKNNQIVSASYPSSNGTTKQRIYHYYPYNVSDKPHFWAGSDSSDIEKAYRGWAHYTALTGITDESGKRYVNWGYNYHPTINNSNTSKIGRAVSSENVGFNRVEILADDSGGITVKKGNLERIYNYRGYYTGNAYVTYTDGNDEKAGCEVGGNYKVQYDHYWYTNTLRHCSSPSGWDCVDGRVGKKVTDLDTGLLKDYIYKDHTSYFKGNNDTVSLKYRFRDEYIDSIYYRVSQEEADKWGDQVRCFDGTDCYYKKERPLYSAGILLSIGLEGQSMSFHDRKQYLYSPAVHDADTNWRDNPNAHYSSYNTSRYWKNIYTTSSDPVANLIKQVDGPRSDVTDVINYTYYPSGSFKGFVHTITDPEGLVTTFNNYTPDGRPTSVTMPNGMSLTLSYHPRGWLTTINEGGAVTSYSYYENGLLKRVTDPEGNWIEYAYHDGRVLKQIKANNGDEINFTAYDHYGQWEELNSKESSGAIRYQQNRNFDALGRLAQNMGQNGQDLKSPYDTEDNIKYFRQKYEDEKGSIEYRDTTLDRDIFGRIRKITYPDGGVIRLDYDKRDNLTKVTDQNGLVTEYTYDGFDNLARIDSPDTGTTKYWYDLAGNVTKSEDQNGTVVDYQYDANNRLIYVTYPGNSAENITFIYDEITDGKNGVGELTTITFEHGSIEYFYNDRAEIIKELRTVEGQTYTTDYQRNLNGEITKITYPSGRQVEYVYNQGLIERVQTRESASSNWLVVADQLSYEPFGPLDSLSFGNGLTLTKDYDLDYRITDNILQRSDGQALKDKFYSYYLTDNISAVVENAGNIESQLFSYDAVDRLTSASGEYGNYAYGYDAVGNRESIQRNSNTHSYSYYSGSHRLKEIKLGSTVIRSFSYDAAGNLTDDIRGTEHFKLSYNSEGRPSTLERHLNGSLTNTTSYKYNPLGQRIMMTTGGNNHYLNYGLDGRMTAEYTDGQTLKAEYIYLHGDLLAVVQPQQVAWAGVNESGTALESIVESNESIGVVASTGTRFYRHSLNGDGEIQTKVEDFGHAKDSAHAGVMIKETNANDAPFVKLVRTAETTFIPIAGEIFIPLVFGKKSLTLEYTDSNNQLVKKTFSDQGDWLRLVRTGNYIDAQVSTNGQSWTTVETVFQPMDEQVQLGVITQNIQSTDQVVFELLAVDGAVYTDQASALYYAYNNHLGAPISLTDQLGNTVWEVSYSPFGETTTQVATVDQPLRLPGQYAYDETGYYYNYFRDYDPSLGRYIQSDPMGLTDGPNTYGYAGGNPLMFIDPFGLSRVSEFKKGMKYLSQYCRKNPGKCEERENWVDELCKSKENGNFSKRKGAKGGEGAYKPFSKKTKEEGRRESCGYCDRSLNGDKKSGRQRNGDHLIAKKCGGNNSIENYIDACFFCNNVKRDKTPRDFESFTDGLCRARKVSKSFNTNRRGVR